MTSQPISKSPRIPLPANQLSLLSLHFTAHAFRNWRYNSGRDDCDLLRRLRWDSFLAVPGTKSLFGSSLVINAAGNHGIEASHLHVLLLIHRCLFCACPLISSKANTSS